MSRFLNIIKSKIWFSIHIFPEGLIRLWQERLLKKLITYSYVNVPLYRELWDSSQLNISDFNKISDLQLFPIINKRTFQAHYIEEYLGRILPWDYDWRSTSGTSGEPFIFLKTKIRNLKAADFLTHRFLFWKGYSAYRIQNTLPTMIILHSSYDYKSRSIISIADFLSDMKGTLEKISKKKIVFVHSYPSILVELARAVIKYPQFKLEVKYASATGENLTDAQREFIEKALGCEVFNRYGMAEFGVIGVECDYHSGFHINVESLFVEIVDENGKSLPAKKHGRVVVTDLRDYAVPFIRYDTGNRGFFIEEPCPCGLKGFKLMIDGRNSEYIAFGSKKIHHLEIDDIMKAFYGYVLQYQMRKIDEKNVILRIVPEKSVNDFMKEKISSSIRNILPKDCDVKIELVNKIERTARGKCQTLINV